MPRKPRSSPKLAKPKLAKPKRKPEARKLCLGCPGFCCKRFWMQLNKRQFRKRLEQVKSGEATLPPMTSKAQYIATFEFALKNFKRLPNRDNWAGVYYGNAYTCRLFDDRLGRCTAHKQRPWTCRQYFCITAGTGETPDAATTKEFKDCRRWGKAVIERRKLTGGHCG